MCVALKSVQVSPTLKRVNILSEIFEPHPPNKQTQNETIAKPNHLQQRYNECKCNIEKYLLSV